VTDSGSEITKSADKPAVSNLLTIFEVVSGKSTSELESAYQGSGYGKFKEDLAEAIIEFVKPIQTKFEEITSSPDQLDSILDKGREYVISQSSPKLEEVYKVVGLGR
jgi:tryptophanyl-tRNA synthetase